MRRVEGQRPTEHVLTLRGQPKKERSAGRPRWAGRLLWMLLLLLSRFSRVRLCATPETAAHQAPLSLGFSRQEHWSGLPFLSPMHESESEVAQSCPTLRDPMDCSPPGSSIHGIFQAGVLEWGAITFSALDAKARFLFHSCLRKRK